MKIAALDPEVTMSKAPAWCAVYAMSLCVFVLIASEFMPLICSAPSRMIFT